MYFNNLLFTPHVEGSGWEIIPGVLFYGLQSDIVDGQMPNRVPHASDYLTVTGGVGTYTFECPVTPAYIAADIDRIWFDGAGAQRTATVLELVSYDFTRTIVKYQDTSPFVIEAIMILSIDYDTPAMRDDFNLSVWWDNTLSRYGYLKGNRSVGKSYWAGVLNDGNTKAWYDMAEDYMIKNGSDLVYQWTDRSGNGNHLLQSTEAFRPLWSNSGVLFNGSDNRMTTAAFTLEQPTQIYLVLKQLTWTANDRIIDGLLSNYGSVYQSGVMPNLIVRAGGLSSQNTNLTLNTFGIIRVLFNSTSSSFQIDETIKLTGNYGPLDMNGFTLGDLAASGNQSNIEVKEVIIRTVVDTTENEQLIYDYLKTKYAL